MSDTVHNVVHVRYQPGQTAAIASDVLFEHDIGQILMIEGLELPDYYQVHFSNSPARGDSYASLGSAEGVAVPDAVLQTGAPVYAFIYLSEPASAETIRLATIYVVPRPELPTDEPTPEEVTIIDQAIAALNEQSGVATAAAEAAAGSASDALASERAAAGSDAAAAESARSAAADALEAEGWARGTQDGEPAGPGEAYYEDNAKFYSEQAAAAVAALESALTLGYANATAIAGTSSSHKDLDDYTTAGNFKITSQANAKTVDNVPIQQAGRLSVFKGPTSAYTFQVYVHIGTGAQHLYIRYKPSSTAPWTAWKQILVAEDIDAAPTSESENPVSSGGVYASVSALQDACVRQLDTAHFGYEYGGLTPGGKPAVAGVYTRLRIKDDKDREGFWVQAGSTISVDTGYKFQVILMSSYSGPRSFTLIDTRTMAPGSYVVPEDCFIKIAIGAVNDAALWQEDADQARSLTPAGEAALAAVHMNLIGGTALELIDELERNESEQETLKTLTDAIPYTALGYHAMWDDLVEEGFVARSEPTYMSYDTEEKWPLYTYTIKAYRDWMAGNYAIVPYDGDSELYPRKQVLIVSGIHGSERCGPQYVYEFVKRLLDRPEYAALRVAYDFTLVPLANPFGFGHSMVSGSGRIHYGQAMSIGGYTIRENTDENKYDGGIRYNSDDPDVWRDINRDFSDAEYIDNDKTYGFVTPEARYLRDLMIAQQFDIVFDVHQSFGYDDTRCGHTAMARNVTEALGPLFARLLTAAGAQTDSEACAFTGKDVRQSCFAQVGSEEHTFRNYVAGFAKDGVGNTLHTDKATLWSFCIESGFYCRLYSGGTAPYNEIATAFGNSYTGNVISAMLEEAL